MKNILISALALTCLASCTFDAYNRVAAPAAFHSRYAVNGSNEVHQAVSDGSNMQVLFRSLVASEPAFFDVDGRPIAWTGSGNIAHFPNQKGDITVSTKAGRFTISQFAAVAKIEPPAVSPFDLSVAQFKDAEPVEAAQLKMAESLDSLKYAIYFEYASSKLNPTGEAAIELLQRDAKSAQTITIVGRADPSGKTALNSRLARARSNSVKSEFVKWGVASSAVKVESAVGISKVEGQIALKQNVPVDLAASSRRTDVTMLVDAKKANKLARDDRFMLVAGI